MTTIYLDTSHLSVLATARRTATRQFATFLSTWRAVKAELVFTRTHLIELRQHVDASVRADRYRLLELLLPIQSDLVTREPLPDRPMLLQEREVLRALWAKGAYEVRSDDAEAIVAWRRQHLDILPARWDTPADVAAIQLLEDAEFGTIVGLMQSAMHVSAGAQRRPRAEPYKRTRLRDLPRTPLSENETNSALAQLQDLVVSDPQIAAMVAQLPGGVNQIDRAFEPLRHMIVRAGEVGVQQAYVELLGFREAPDDRRYLDQFSDLLMFRRHLRIALAVLNPGAEIETLAQQVSPEDCPGYWLARSVDLEIRKAEAEPASSNPYDLDHILYAPYVDHFFSDKRIATYINNVRRRDGTITTVANMPLAVATPAHVDALTEAVRRVSQNAGSRESAS